MRILDFGPFYEKLHDQLLACAEHPSLWQREAHDLVEKFAGNNHKNISDMLQIMHRAQRVLQVHAAKLENNEGFWADCSREHERLPLWNQFGEPPVKAEVQHALVDRMWLVNKKKKKPIVLSLGYGTYSMGHYLIQKCRQDQTPFRIAFEEDNFLALMSKHADATGMDAAGAAMAAIYQDASKALMIWPNDLELGKKIEMDAAALDNRNSYLGHVYAVWRDRMDNKGMSFTRLPTTADAKADNMAPSEYFKIFYEMCDQPWKQIKTAHKALIKKLNAAGQIAFQNDDGTEITMDIEGFTFYSSVDDPTNVPGSEVFSAPKPNSANGKIVAKGQFLIPSSGGKIAKNLTLIFKDGKIDVEQSSAEEGWNDFRAFLARDEANLRIGEIGIGTNPHLRRHVIHPILVEKIAGSFHIALGHSINRTKDENNQPVNVNNGNGGDDHWDITTMLFGKGGKILLDGEAIMENGLFLGRQFDVLNRGWAAVPINQRPSYWKNFLGYRSNGESNWDNRSSFGFPYRY